METQKVDIQVDDFEWPQHLDACGEIWRTDEYDEVNQIRTVIFFFEGVPQGDDRKNLTYIYELQSYCDGWIRSIVIEDFGKICAG